MFRSLLCWLVVLSLTDGAWAQSDGNAELFQALGRTDCTVVPLWLDRVGPGETRPDFPDGTFRSPEGTLLFRPVVQAEMILIPPPAGTRSTGATVLFCPGGGYGALETVSIAQGSKWLNAMGATAVLLKYRIPRRSAELPPYHLPLMDVQRALGLLRSRAAEWKLDPQKIGIAGFSAGGHLAAMASQHHAKRSYDAVDEHDQVSCRPDFCILLYAAYLTNPIYETKPDPALEQERMSPERTPPTFIAVVRPDKFTIGCATHMAALQKAKVPAELHVFSSGGHGGCFDRYPLLGWGYEAARFLKDHGILDEASAKIGDAWLAEREAEVKAKAERTLIDTAGAAKAKPRVDAAAKPQGAPSDALAGDALTAGEVELKKLLGDSVSMIPVWPSGTRDDDPLKTTETTPTLPGENEKLRITNVVRPSLMVMRAARPDGRAVVLMPGGGYSRLAIQHEGVDIGRWLNEQGITVFLLKYRVPKRDGVHVALQDAQRAIRLVRSRAAEFGIDPDWIGVCGFSAGGNLAALCCHQYEQPSYAALDAHDAASCRPNFGLLVYPAYLGEKDGTLVETFTKPIRNRTPPIFVAFAANDGLITGSFPYVLALREARVPVAFHVYESGGHGKGLAASGYPFSRWTFAAERWLNDLLWIDAPTKGTAKPK